MHRISVQLTDVQYDRLRRESGLTGRSMSDLVRAAVDQVYDTSQERLRRAIVESHGAWADRDDIGDGAAWVERIRQPFNERRRELEWD
ncbi:MAG TPA: ribbon-helix-helix protein, CopG family [Acidimicrobiales bacterium]